MDRHAVLEDGRAQSGAGGRLLDVAQARSEVVPLSESMAWFADLVGTFVAGGSYLLAGAPGTRKSGLALQLALGLARAGRKVLFILTEEPAARLKERAIRMCGGWPPEDAWTALSNLHVEPNLSDLQMLPGYLAQQALSPAGMHHGAKLVIIDSIQGQGLSSAATRKYERLYEAIRLCAGAGITTLLISHVTKRGDIAGPRDLEHNVDCVLVLRRTLSYRLLFVPKNRFGPMVLRDPLPLALDTVTLAMSVSPHARSMTSVARTWLGAGVGPAEVQAAISLAGFGCRGKVTAPGLPRKEIEQLVACCAQVPGMEIDDLEFTVLARLPGQKRYSDIVGLPLCLSLISSYLRQPVPRHQVQIGEIDLRRNLRELDDLLVNDLGAALTIGELRNPVRLLVPPMAAFHLPAGKGVEIVPCAGLEDAMLATWPDLH